MNNRTSPLKSESGAAVLIAVLALTLIASASFFLTKAPVELARTNAESAIRTDRDAFMKEINNRLSVEGFCTGSLGGTAYSANPANPVNVAALPNVDAAGAVVGGEFIAQSGQLVEGYPNFIVNSMRLQHVARSTASNNEHVAQLSINMRANQDNLGSRGWTRNFGLKVRTDAGGQIVSCGTNEDVSQGVCEAMGGRYDYVSGNCETSPRAFGNQACASGKAIGGFDANGNALCNRDMPVPAPRPYYPPEGIPGVTPPLAYTPPVTQCLAGQVRINGQCYDPNRSETAPPQTGSGSPTGGPSNPSAPSTCQNGYLYNSSSNSCYCPHPLTVKTVSGVKMCSADYRVTCSSGHQECNGYCYPSCGANETRNSTTCACENQCALIAGSTWNGSTCACPSGYTAVSSRGRRGSSGSCVEVCPTAGYFRDRRSGTCRPSAPPCVYPKVYDSSGACVDPAPKNCIFVAADGVSHTMAPNTSRQFTTYPNSIIHPCTHPKTGIRVEFQIRDQIVQCNGTTGSALLTSDTGPVTNGFDPAHACQDPAPTTCHLSTSAGGSVTYNSGQTATYDIDLGERIESCPSPKLGKQTVREFQSVTKTCTNGVWGNEVNGTFSQIITEYGCTDPACTYVHNGQTYTLLVGQSQIYNEEEEDFDVLCPSSQGYYTVTSNYTLTFSCSSGYVGQQIYGIEGPRLTRDTQGESCY
ncbi:MAG: hypothetical protein COT74_12270 [Bdellovibrionales bacterium CG10_big_fil_rev_8_21_14_0_10_45_34]|nr:MAG: hypothetical protein COT74_12270 [Bdellovibrionales bacterium CG10_big_fil_rev_8_21_14_0_10_45_34]